MDVCTAPEMAPCGRCFYNEGPEAKKQKKKFSQADINEKVKLAVEKKAAEDAKKQPRKKLVATAGSQCSCNCLQK